MSQTASGTADYPMNLLSFTVQVKLFKNTKTEADLTTSYIYDTYDVT